MSIRQRAEAWLRERVRGHIINHNRKPSGPHEERHGSILIEGSAHVRTAEGRDLLTAHWAHGRRAGWGALELTIDAADQRITLSAGIPGAHYWLSLERLPGLLFEILPMNAHRPGRRFLTRKIGVRLHGGAIWASFWEDTGEWRATDPWWMRGRLGLDDIAKAILGPEKYQAEVLEERSVAIPMPEKTYVAHAKRSLATWTRQRWPWPPLAREQVIVQLDIPDGIPTDHKGPLYGISMWTSTIDQAVGEVVTDVHRSRGGFRVPACEQPATPAA